MSLRLRIGSLFSGIGGLGLGLEHAGVGEVAWQVEIDPWCRGVLAMHYPNARRFADVRKVGAQQLAPVEVICGGFPCQDISVAGKRTEGLAGKRSGLWREFARIVTELRPRFVVVENVARLVTSGLDVVVADLDAAGYRVEGRIIAASDVGAPHRRERLFLLAHTARAGLQGMHGSEGCGEGWRARSAQSGATVADAGHDGRSERSERDDDDRRDAPRIVADGCDSAVADGDGVRLFEEASGVEIGSRYDAARIGEAVRMVLAARRDGGLPEVLARLRNNADHLTALVTALDSVVRDSSLVASDSERRTA